MEVSQQSSMSALSEPSSKSLTLPITESATHVTESSPTSVGATQIIAELSPTLFTSPSTASTANDLSAHLVEPTPTSAEPTSTSVEPPSASDREVAMSQSFQEMSSVPSLWPQSDTLVMSSEYSPSSNLTSSFSDDYTYTFSTSTQIENSAISLSSFGNATLFEATPHLASSNATNTQSELIPDLSQSFYSVASTVEDTTQTVSPHSVTETVEDTTQTVSPHSVTETVEDTAQTVSPHSVTETDEDTTQTVSPHSVTETDEGITQTVNSLVTFSGYESVTISFFVPESSSEYNSMTSETAFESNINTLPVTDSITSADTASLVTTMAPRVETPVPHQTSSITPTTIVISSSSDIASPTSSPTSSPTESTSPVQDLPGKSSEGLSTGGKVAIGILVPLAVIGLIILGVFLYRRYNWNRGSFKNFLQPGVHYRAYTNETFTDDDDATMGGSWRKMSDS
ncbi:hypothetical protein BsWGS_05865 [Bradybaena similaris]